MLRAKGFSLIEFLTVLAIAGAIFLFCVPFSNDNLDRNSVEVIKSELSQVILYSRNMAMLTGKNLTLNPIADDDQWAKGIVLFVDNPKHQYREGDEVIHRWQWQYKRIRIKWYGFQSNEYMRFSSDIKDAAANGHFSIFFQQMEVERIVVNRLGRVVAQGKIF